MGTGLGYDLNGLRRDGYTGIFLNNKIEKEKEKSAKLQVEEG